MRQSQHAVRHWIDPAPGAVAGALNGVHGYHADFLETISSDVYPLLRGNLTVVDPASNSVPGVNAGIANPNAICLAISVTEPVKAGTLKIPGITGMRRLLSVWQKWDSREVVQIANPWQKQSSSDGCPSRTGLVSSMKQNTPSLKKLS